MGRLNPRPSRQRGQDQVQYDGLELLVEAVSVYVQTGGRFDATTWRLVRELADSVAAEETGQPQPSNGIWEQRDSALLIGGDLGRWLVLDGCGPGESGDI